MSNKVRAVMDFILGAVIAMSVSIPLQWYLTDNPEPMEVEDVVISGGEVAFTRTVNKDFSGYWSVRIFRNGKQTCDGSGKDDYLLKEEATQVFTLTEFVGNGCDLVDGGIYLLLVEWTVFGEDEDASQIVFLKEFIYEG